MNRMNAAMAAALAVSVSGPVSAASVQTDDEVHATLAAQGYTDITNVKRDGNTWSVDARAAGNEFKLRIDPASGYAYPDAANAGLSQLDIIAAIVSRGYTNVSDVRFFGGVWTASATSSTGKNVRIKVDPADGEVIDENE